MNKIFYITRSYTHSAFSGGAIMREAAVELLKLNGFDVVVVTVAASEELEEVKPNFISLYHSGESQKVRLIKERIGLVDDYLQSWSQKVISYLSPIISSKDTIFCTSGGDLASFIVGHSLKNLTGAKFVANFRDPVSYTYFNDERLGRFTHINRDKIFYELISNADLIITSCNSYKAFLESKLSNEIINNHFGYIESSPHVCDFSTRKSTSKFSTFYGGTLGKYQNPKLVSNFFNSYNGALLDIYGHSGLKVTQGKNIQLFNSLPRAEFLSHTVNKYDFGVVSLGANYFGACIPKIYEYINMAMPIIGFLPKGEARDIINDNNFGYVALPSSPRDLKSKLSSLLKEQCSLTEMNLNLKNSRADWSMNKLIIPLVERLHNL